MHPSTKTANKSFRHALKSVEGHWGLIQKISSHGDPDCGKWFAQSFHGKKELAKACWGKAGDPAIEWTLKVDGIWWGKPKSGSAVGLPCWARHAQDVEFKAICPQGVGQSLPALIDFGAQLLGARIVEGFEPWARRSWSHDRAWHIHEQWNGHGAIPGTGKSTRWHKKTDDRSIKATVSLAAQARLEASCLDDDDGCGLMDPSGWTVRLGARLRQWAGRLEDIAVRDPDYSFERARSGRGWKNQKKARSCSERLSKSHMDRPEDVWIERQDAIREEHGSEEA
jgi:hypothetical protein